MESILVIDDEPAVRQLVARALGDAGYHVFGAENGLEGVARARQLLPDLVLCDVRMEKLDGYGTLSRLRSDEATKTIPFILMTGDADHAGMRQGMELGADDYLPKPFSIAELQAAIKARLSKHLALREEAEQRLASLRANISYALPHELRTPLNGILGFADLLVQDHGDLEREEVASIAQTIFDSAQRLHRTIENTLLYAQLELLGGDPAKLRSLRADKIEDAAVPVATAAETRARACDRLADLQLSLSRARAAIGERHLRCIVTELVDNAFKFSSAGTAVRVAVGPSDDGLRLVVADAGRGMRPQHIADVGAYMQFERRVYEQQGAGLGLAIATRLTELHGGTLAIRSSMEPPLGTEVTVLLPEPTGAAPLMATTGTGEPGANI
jgi:signal transduction histidine kinase